VAFIYVSASAHANLTINYATLYPTALQLLRLILPTLKAPDGRGKPYPIPTDASIDAGMRDTCRQENGRRVLTVAEVRSAVWRSAFDLFDVVIDTHCPLQHGGTSSGFTSRICVDASLTQHLLETVVVTLDSMRSFAQSVSVAQLSTLHALVRGVLPTVSGDTGGALLSRLLYIIDQMLHNVPCDQISSVAFDQLELMARSLVHTVGLITLASNLTRYLYLLA
jgi:hypothetical protein